MDKQFLTGLERESLHEEYDCMQCSEPITNPICHDCLSDRILKWLNLYPNVKKKVIKELKEYRKDINNNVLKAINCVACKNKNAALCPYCFTEGIFNILKRKKVDRMVIMDFLSTFNFDLKHEGYILEAVEEKLY